MADTIPLRNYRIMPHPAHIRIEGDSIELVLPRFFGRRRLVVPIDGLAVADLTTSSPDLADEVFRDPIAVPYLFTTGPVTDPTILLLFREPRRAPPLRLSPAVEPNNDLTFGWWASRSRAGAHIDGAYLRAVDPGDATRRLVSAGATEIDDPARWLRTHRDVVTNPIERDRRLTHATRSLWLRRTATTLMFGSVLAVQAIGGEDAPDAGFVGFGLVFGAGLLLRRASGRPPT